MIINKIPLVTIISLTYNHELYIRQCLDGFLMQKTNFNFEVLIHDDASTDNTANIIREYEEKYPEIIKPIYQTENQYSKGGGIIHKFLLPRSKGKYITMCEGDDYWTDPFKLQKQVDFLEENPEYGMVYTDAMSYNQITGQKREMKTSQVNTVEDILTYNKVYTLTTCFKKQLMEDYIKEISPNLPKFPFGDYPMWIYFFSREKLYYLSGYTAVYRVLDNSASHRGNIDKRLYYEKKVYECKLYMINKLFKDEINDQLLNKIKQRHAFYMLHLPIKLNSKQKFLDNYYFIKQIDNNLIKILFYLHKLNFLFFSLAYRTFHKIVRKLYIIEKKLNNYI